MGTISVFPVCSLGGITVDVTKTGTYFTVFREIIGVPNSLEKVRGMIDRTEAVLSVIDFEVPLDRQVQYYLLEGATFPVTFANYSTQVIATSQSMQNACGIDMLLRDLLSPTTSINTEFCLGQLGDTTFEVRAGLFNVLGRRAPVVVVDSASTHRGTLKFIARTEQEILRLRESLRDPDPMLLQTVGYDLGGVGNRTGQLYFQPLTVTERWMPNGKIRQRVFEIEYVEIDPPPLTTVYTRDLNTYNEVLAHFVTYNAITASSRAYSQLLYEAL